MLTIESQATFSLAKELANPMRMYDYKLQFDTNLACIVCTAASNCREIKGSVKEITDPL